jgi:hypothetical protein
MVLEPYREAFSDKHEGCMTGGDIPPHRYLFHAYTYQYHLMEFSSILISVVRPPLRSFNFFVRAETPPSARIHHRARKEADEDSALASHSVLSRLFPVEHMGH